MDATEIPAIITSQAQDRGIIDGGRVVKVLDLGQHAYADTFIAADQLHLSEPIFPLTVCLDRDTGHLQLGYISRAHDRYNLYAYSYTSSNSVVSRRHWDNFATDMRNNHDCSGLVIEIGSNDGYLIQQFKSNDTRCLAVDSSQAMCDLAKQQGVETFNALFDQHTAQEIKKVWGSANLIIANNVFNHANDPVDFVKGVRDLLGATGLFVFEVPYWGAMMKSGRFPDMIYHEHPSYFTVRSTWHMLKAAGLEMRNFSVVDYHGGSLRVTAQIDRGSTMPLPIHAAIDEEYKSGLFDEDFYSTLQSKLTRDRNRWLKNFYEIRCREPENPVIAVGAAAKGNTWLTWHGLNHTHISAVTDASPHKQGKFTPWSRIPVTGDEEFSRYDQPYALILSWNIGQGLKDVLLKINPKIKFLNQ